MAEQSPVGHAHLCALRAVPGTFEYLHGLSRIHAVRPAAVSHHLAVGRQLAQPLLQFTQRNRHGARQMTGLVFIRRTHVEHHDVAGTHPLAKIPGSDGLQVLAVPEIGAGGAVCFGQARLRQPLRLPHKVDDGIVRQTVVDIGAVATGLDELRRAQHTQVRAGVLDGKVAGLGQRLNGFLALREQVEQLDAGGRRERLADAREFLVEPVFPVAVAITPVFYGILEYTGRAATSRHRPGADRALAARYLISSFATASPSRAPQRCPMAELSVMIATWLFTSLRPTGES